jgi:hypothetical protein
MIEALIYGLQFAVSILGVVGAVIVSFLAILYFLDE